jgi:hypothetical protein
VQVVPIVATLTFPELQLVAGALGQPLLAVVRTGSEQVAAERSMLPHVKVQLAAVGIGV